MQRSHNILISSLSEVENKWRWLHVDRQREVLFLKNWYQICLYLFEYISYCDSKYCHQIPELWNFWNFCEILNLSSAHACHVESIYIYGLTSASTARSYAIFISPSCKARSNLCSGSIDTASAWDLKPWKKEKCTGRSNLCSGSMETTDAKTLYG